MAEDTYQDDGLPERYRTYSAHELALREISPVLLVRAQVQLAEEFELFKDVTAYCMKLQDRLSYGYPIVIRGIELPRRQGRLLFATPFMLSPQTRALLFDAQGKARVPRILHAQDELLALERRSREAPLATQVWMPYQAAFRFVTALCAAQLLQYERDMSLIKKDTFWNMEKPYGI